MVRNVSRLTSGVGLLFLVTLVSCAGSPPSKQGAEHGGLAPCPSSPNCVCSDSRGGEHAVAPLVLAVPPAQAWAAIQKAVAEMPRCQIVEATDDSLHAECRSALFRFVDDLEIQLRPEEGIAALRSASRVGYSDLGVNRKRVESLRADLAAGGVVRGEASSAR